MIWLAEDSRVIADNRYVCMTCRAMYITEMQKSGNRGMRKKKFVLQRAARWQLLPMIYVQPRWVWPTVTIINSTAQDTRAILNNFIRPIKSYIKSFLLSHLMVTMINFTLDGIATDGTELLNSGICAVTMSSNTKLQYSIYEGLVFKSTNNQNLNPD